MTTAAPTKQLSIEDRCDRCGAQAYVQVKLSQGMLHFCGHHYTEYAPKLSSVAVEVVDESSTIP